MQLTRKQTVTLYADRVSQQWVVCDSEGNYWLLPANDKGWEGRQPYSPSEATELEPVPGHYKYMLGLKDELSPSI